MYRRRLAGAKGRTDLTHPYLAAMKSVASVMGLDDPYEVPRRYSWEQLWLYLSGAKAEQMKRSVSEMHRRAGAKYVTSVGDFLAQVKGRQ